MNNVTDTPIVGKIKVRNVRPGYAVATGAIAGWGILMIGVHTDDLTLAAARFVATVKGMQEAGQLQ